MKLHLGCGSRNFGENWIHVDAQKLPHIDFNDVTSFPFENDIFSVIYASHLIAYFDREEIIPILQEWRRVLKPGGILRLATPNVYQMGELYINLKVTLEDILGPLYGRMESNGKIIYHKTTYDYVDLKKLLLNVGFKDVSIYDWRKTEHAQFDDHSQAYLNPKGDKENGTLISLNIEAIKI